MPGYVPPGSSGVARLLLGSPGYAVGWQEPLYLANPAAGSEWTHTVDGRWFERLLAVRYVLTTSAVVANRSARLALANADGKHVLAVPATGLVAAGTAVTVHLTAGAPAFASGTTGVSDGYLPDLMVPSGWTWHINTAGLDAGDTETGIVLLVQRYMNDAAEITAAG